MRIISRVVPPAVGRRQESATVFKMAERCAKSGRFKTARKRHYDESIQRQPLEPIVEELPQAETQSQCDNAQPNNSFCVQGRRVIEVFLADMMRQCKQCAKDGHDVPLLLHDIVKETVGGLGSAWHIKCDQCSQIQRVYTGKRHDIQTVRPPIPGRVRRKAYTYDVNTKFSFGESASSVIDNQMICCLCLAYIFMQRLGVLFT